MGESMKNTSILYAADGFVLCGKFEGDSLRSVSKTPTIGDSARWTVQKSVETLARGSDSVSVCARGRDYTYFRELFADSAVKVVNGDVAFMAGAMLSEYTVGCKTPAVVTLGAETCFCYCENGEIQVISDGSPCFSDPPIEELGGSAEERGRAIGNFIRYRAERLNLDSVIIGGNDPTFICSLPESVSGEAGVKIKIASDFESVVMLGAHACLNGLAKIGRAVETGLPFGRTFDTLHLPENLIEAVISPEPAEDVDMSPAAQSARVDEALENPIGSSRLRDMAIGKSRVLVITSDHTRPVPSAVTIPKLLSEIRAGSPNAEIVILIATGMHRPCTRDEIERKLGASVLENERVECHDCRDASNLVDMGVLPSGGRLILNRRVKWADLIVSDGFIEPHFFAGFSGGRKSVLPGIAGEETVRYNHNAEFIENPNARQGVLDNNPIHADMLFAARAAGLRFILNVIIDSEKRIAAAVAGDVQMAHAEGCRICLSRTSVKRRLSDIVVTSNGGYPLDQNIYQAVKGMTAAEACVNPGGAIIMVSECSDGTGGDNFLRIIEESETPGALIEKASRVAKEKTPADQWQAQIFARVLARAKVYFVTDEKNRRYVENMRMTYAKSCDWAVRDSIAQKSGAKVTVIPDGVGIIIGD